MSGRRRMSPYRFIVFGSGVPQEDPAALRDGAHPRSTGVTPAPRVQGVQETLIRDGGAMRSPETQLRTAPRCAPFEVEDLHGHAGRPDAGCPNLVLRVPQRGIQGAFKVEVHNCEWGRATGADAVHGHPTSESGRNVESAVAVALHGRHPRWGPGPPATPP